MPCTAHDFNGRQSDSPQELRRYFWDMQPQMPATAEMESEREKMRAFLRKRLGMKFPGDAEYPAEKTQGEIQ